MKRFAMFLLSSVVAAAFAGAVFGQTSDPASADKGASTQAPATPSTTPAPDVSQAPAAQATPAPASVAKAAPVSTPAMDRVKERGMKISAKDRADVEKKLDDIEKEIETEAMKGEPAVADRLAADFGLTADALTAEKSQFGRGWGELTVAHTLIANAKTDATLSDLFALRSQAMGWGAIAAGLDLKLGDVVSAVRSEQRVAVGLDKGDGKAALIHTDLADAGAMKAKPEKVSTKTPKGQVKGTEASTGAGAGVDLGKASGK
jgi:hypothetical protein